MAFYLVTPSVGGEVTKVFATSGGTGAAPGGGTLWGFFLFSTPRGSGGLFGVLDAELRLLF